MDTSPAGCMHRRDTGSVRVSIEDSVYELLRKKVEPFRVKVERREREDERLKTVGEVFDESTLMALYSILNKGILDTVEGNLSSGKEANIFLARDGSGNYVAVKIYRIHTTSFRKFAPYLDGDPRFKSLPRDHRALVFTWAKKEFKNLARLADSGVRVPRPLFQLKNVLVMEYIGTDEFPARTMKEVPPDDPEGAFAWSMETVEKMVTVSALVHADLSEYNILAMPGTGELVIIDVAQSVVLDHPMSGEFLQRDLRNLCRFFGRLGVDTGAPPEERTAGLMKRGAKRKRGRR